MPLWAIILGVLATMATLSVMVWAACKVAGDAEDRWVAQSHSDNAREQARQQVANAEHVAMPLIEGAALTLSAATPPAVDAPVHTIRNRTKGQA